MTDVILIATIVAFFVAAALLVRVRPGNGWPGAGTTPRSVRMKKPASWRHQPMGPPTANLYRVTISPDDR
jgi:hypothetical protein